MKFNRFVSISILLGATIGLTSPAAAGYNRDSRPESRKNMIWESEITIDDEVTIPGFWRPRSRTGYQWIDAAQDEAGRWHTGYWVPINADKMAEQTHYPGYWGPSIRDGFVWLNREDRAGEYPDGSWEKMNSFQMDKSPLKWVPGHWNGRRWVDGYWRIPKKEGCIWVEGYYRPNGRWQEARWEPEPEDLQE